MTLSPRIAEQVLEIPCNLIEEDPANARKTVSQHFFEWLKRNIEKRGQLEPAWVRELPPGKSHQYRIISGHTRFRAVQALNRPLRAIVLQGSQDEVDQTIVALIANLGRRGLTAGENADLCANLRGMGRSNAVIAEDLGRSEKWVQDHLTLHDALSPEVQILLGPGAPSGVPLSTAAGLHLSKLPSPEDQARAVSMMHNRGSFSADAAKNAVAEISAEAGRSRRPRSKQRNPRTSAVRLTEALWAVSRLREELRREDPDGYMLSRMPGELAALQAACESASRAVSELPQWLSGVRDKTSGSG